MQPLPVAVRQKPRNPASLRIGEKGTEPAFRRPAAQGRIARLLETLWLRLFLIGETVFYAFRRKREAYNRNAIALKEHRQSLSRFRP